MSPTASEVPELTDAAMDNEDRDRLTALLSETPLMVDELVRECQLSAAMVQTILLELELAGRVARQLGNHVSLVT